MRPHQVTDYVDPRGGHHTGTQALPPAREERRPWWRLFGRRKHRNL